MSSASGRREPPLPDRVLVLTFGQGNLDDLDRTLFAPIRKSISKGKWKQVILLPSQQTLPLARQIAGQEPVFRIEPLPRAGQENDADECFAHFDGVLSRIIDAGTPAAHITIDFTRGTKGMSAAILLAAVARAYPSSAM